MATANTHPCCVHPSILSADFVNLEAELARIGNADAVHVDVMDNHFVPNLTLGLPVVQRLQQVFESIGKRPQGKSCPAIDGLIEEAEEVMDEYKGAPAHDAGLLAAAQASEHYEIARYGTLASWAKQLGNEEGERLLRETLEEEKRTDEILTGLAESVLNAAAEQQAA